MPNTTEKKQGKVVYTIRKNGEKTFWNRIGYGSVNKDGSINVQLFSLPVNGTLNIRDPKVSEATNEEVEG